MAASTDTLKAIAGDKSLPLEVRRAAWRAFNRTMQPGTPDENRDELSYNGWSNYPTWAVNLWLSNVKDLYNMTTDAVALEIRRDDEDNMLRSHVVDAIKEIVEDVTPDLGASFAADLLGYAFDMVDWYEIADAWIEDSSVSAEVDC